MIERRKRLADGTFGDVESVTGQESSKEKLVRMEVENAALALELVNKEIQITSIEKNYAYLTLELVSKGVI